LTIQSLVDIGSERLRIDVRQATPASEEGCCVEAWSMKRSEFGYGPPVAGDNEAFPGEYTVDDFAAVIAQLSNTHTSHLRSVSRVRPKRSEPECLLQAVLRLLAESKRTFNRLHQVDVGR
jgi:hypothetical protein